MSSLSASPRTAFLRRAYGASKSVDVKALVAAGLSGKDLRDEIAVLRLEAIKMVKI